MFDTHCHLDLPVFNADIDSVLQRAKCAGFHYFMIPGIELSTQEKIMKMAEEDSAIFFASGIHPNNAADLPVDWDDKVVQNAHHPRCRAIGEIGLDFYREYCPAEVQIQVFKRQLEIAADLDLPVIVHCRNAYESLWPILSAWMTAAPGRKAVLHAFDETKERAIAAVEIGITIGIGGTYTYTKKNERRLEILRSIPIESILLETDCPYLTAVPHRGERNEPAYAAYTLKKIAEVKTISYEEADRQTEKNAMRFFKLADSSLLEMGNNSVFG